MMGTGQGRVVGSRGLRRELALKKAHQMLQLLAEVGDFLVQVVDLENQKRNHILHLYGSPRVKVLALNFSLGQTAVIARLDEIQSGTPAKSLNPSSKVLAAEKMSRF